MDFRFLCAALVPLALAIPGQAETINPPESVMHEEVEAHPADPISARLNDALSMLFASGFDILDEDAYRAMLEALIRHYDPDAGIVHDEQDEERQRRRNGLVFMADVPLVWSTNQLALAQEERADLGDADYADLISAPDTVVLRLDDMDAERLGWFHARRLLRAEKPTPLVLVTRDADQQVRTQRVERAETLLPAIEAPEDLPFQLGYLQIHRLHKQTGDRIAEQVREWADANYHGIVLDLRGADGSDLDSVRAVASLFTQRGGHLFAYRDREDQDIYVAQAEGGPAIGLPVMVLVDGETGGAAEVLAAVLSDSVRGAMLFGQPTRGDFLVREMLSLPDGLTVRLATRVLVTGDGTVYTGRQGVQPDVLSLRDETPVIAKSTRIRRTEILDEERDQLALHQRTRGDATLRRAVDVLLGLRALDIRPSLSH